MKREQITSRKEYDKVMSEIEALLQKATNKGGFEKLSKTDKKKLSQLSSMAEQFEDDIPLMPMKAPKSLEEMLRYKMYEKGWRQKQLAAILEISEATISGLLSGRRKLSIEIAKKLHTKLGIDAHFLLTTS
ncbi:MAG: helix-turn-helix domain-containing protein [Crocinitomicaceae bacterium]